MIARSPVLGEFMGTFVLLVLGNGVCAALTLKKSQLYVGPLLLLTLPDLTWPSALHTPPAPPR